MMDINLNSDSPVSIKISFNKLLERYEELAKSNNKYTAKKARRVLDIAAKHPALRAGFTDISLLETYKDYALVFYSAHQQCIWSAHQ